MEISMTLFWLLGLTHFFLPAHAADVTSIAISTAAISSWEEQKFKGSTDYQPVIIDGVTALKAYSNSSASGLYLQQRIDLQHTPYLNWRWRVDKALAQLDETSRNGDDYAARIYIIIDGGVMFWKTRALSYVWSSMMEPGTVWNNAFAGSKVKMLALRNGSHKTAAWHSEKRNILVDLQHYFGEEIRYIDAVAIMTDTDNSKGEAIAYYADIFFSRQ